MAETFGCSMRTIERWTAENGFPAAHMPNGMLCTSVALIDLWLLRRLERRCGVDDDVRASVPVEEVKS